MHSLMKQRQPLQTFDCVIKKLYDCCLRSVAAFGLKFPGARKKLWKRMGRKEKELDAAKPNVCSY